MAKTGVRQYLLDQYGADNSKIGWKDLGSNGGIVTYNGKDLANIAENSIMDGSSYMDANTLSQAVGDYNTKYGNTFTPKAAPQAAPQTTYSPKTNYTESIDGLLKSILNPTPFTYNPESDPAYQSYKTQYTNLGNQAMQNTMATDAALTGGRQNSWATTAGNQANNAYMQQLSNIIPTLEQNAYNKQQNDLSNKYNALNMINTLESKDYNRFVDQRNYDTSVGQWQKEFDMAKTSQDITDAINKINLDSLPDQIALQMKGLEQDLALGDINIQTAKAQLSKLLTAGSGSGSSTSYGTTTNPEIMKQAQSYIESLYMTDKKSGKTSFNTGKAQSYLNGLLKSGLITMQDMNYLLSMNGIKTSGGTASPKAQPQAPNTMGTALNGAFNNVGDTLYNLAGGTKATAPTAQNYSGQKLTVPQSMTTPNNSWMQGINSGNQAAAQVNTELKDIKGQFKSLNEALSFVQSYQGEYETMLGTAGYKALVDQLKSSY